MEGSRVNSLGELQALLKVITEQRNQALNQAAALGAKVMVLDAENQTLRKQLEELQPKPAKPRRKTS